MTFNRKSAAVVCFVLAIMTGAAIALAQQGPFVDFAHPDDGSTIGRGRIVHVIAVARHADPPADGRLQYSENSGVTWSDLSGMAIRGRTISGDYHPSASQPSIVRFRTSSPTTPWFGSQIAVFVE